MAYLQRNCRASYYDTPVTTLISTMDGYDSYVRSPPPLSRTTTRERDEYRSSDPYRDRRRSPGILPSAQSHPPAADADFLQIVVAEVIVIGDGLAHPLRSTATSLTVFLVTTITVAMIIATVVAHRLNHPPSTAMSRDKSKRYLHCS